MFDNNTHSDLAVAEAVRMSIEIPFFFEAYNYGNRLVVDGGVLGPIRKLCNAVQGQHGLSLAFPPVRLAETQEAGAELAGSNRAEGTRRAAAAAV